MSQRFPGRRRSKRITIVASELDHALLELSLGRLGYEVGTLPAERIPLQLIEEHQPDLLIIGVHYGQDHGLNILKALNSHLYPLVLVIANDSQILDDIAAQPDIYACDHTLSSPIDLHRLYAVVEELIGPPA